MYNPRTKKFAVSVVRKVSSDETYYRISYGDSWMMLTVVRKKTFDQWDPWMSDGIFFGRTSGSLLSCLIDYYDFCI